MYAEAIRDEQAKVLRTIRPLDAGSLVRGQSRGYRAEGHVDPRSEVPTYAALRLQIASWRWEGVPFFVRAGKCLATTATEVFIKLKGPPPVVFREPPQPRANYIRFRLSPEVVIALGARAKRPGDRMEGRPVELSVVEQPGQGWDGRMGDYERLLGDAMAGDATLFASQDAVEAAWAIVDPVLVDAHELHESSRAAGARRRRIGWSPAREDGTRRGGKRPEPGDGDRDRARGSAPPHWPHFAAAAAAAAVPAGFASGISRALKAAAWEGFSQSV